MALSPMSDSPGGLEGKVPACNAGDPALIHGLGRSEKEVATHSSTLAWKIPRTESMGSQRVGHD